MITTSSPISIIKDIRSGLLDEFLEDLQREVADRIKANREIQKIETFHELRVGDEVEFNDKASPKYLNGCRAKVHEKVRKNVRVKLLETRKKYREGAVVTTPTSIITKIA